MMEHLTPYITPALILGVGIFIGSVKTDLKNFRNEFAAFKAECTAKNCYPKKKK